MAKTFKSITVAELRELLENEDPEALVCFSSDYGDYHHTEQAFPITGVFEEVGVIEEGGYSTSGWKVVDPGDDLEEDDDATEIQTVLKIS